MSAITSPNFYRITGTDLFSKNNKTKKVAERSSRKVKINSSAWMIKMSLMILWPIIKSIVKLRKGATKWAIYSSWESRYRASWLTRTVKKKRRIWENEREIVAVHLTKKSRKISRAIFLPLEVSEHFFKTMSSSNFDFASISSPWYE